MARGQTGVVARIGVEGGQAVVRLRTLEKVGALRGDVRVPLSAIRAVRAVSKPRGEVRGWRAPGTEVPFVVVLGTFRRRASRQFVAVYRSRPGVVVELDRGQAGFDRLIVSAPEPEETCRLLGGGRGAETGGTGTDELLAADA